MKLLRNEAKAKYGSLPAPAPETKAETDDNGDIGMQLLKVIDMETGENIPIEEHLAQRRKLS